MNQIEPPYSQLLADRKKISMEDLQIVEHVVRVDPKVIEQCEISGIPREDMHKVYCDRMYAASSSRSRLMEI